MTTVDVLVVGGGPSGLSAAIGAAENGASVMVVDEWPVFGGRLRYRRADLTLGDGAMSPSSLVATLIDRATTAGVVMKASTVAWSAFAGSGGLEVGVREGGRSADAVTPGRLILATGTSDRAAIVPGATCPGVLTARALQILLNVHGERPGRRIAILGDDRSDELAQDIEAAGGEVTRKVSAAELSSVAIYGGDGVHAISIGDERIDVDIIVTALGTLPDSQLAGMLGCVVAPGPAWPPRPRRDGQGRLSVPNVASSGSAAGIDSIERAIVDGFMVGRGRNDGPEGRSFVAELVAHGGGSR